MKKKMFWTSAGIFAALLAVIALLLWWRQTYVRISDRLLERNTPSLEIRLESGDLERVATLAHLEQLDLLDSRLTFQEIEQLQAELPDCRICWEVPFQGGYVRSDTTTLTVDHLTDADVSMLSFFPELEMVDAGNCQDYPQLMELKRRYPSVALSYGVMLDGKKQDSAAERLTIQNASPQEVAQALAYLPQVTEVTFQQVLEAPQLLELTQAYPDLHIRATFNICGIEVSNDAQQIDLSNIPMENTAAVEAAVAYMPNLEKVDMCGCGISNEDMEALNQRHERIQFVWIVQIGFIPTRTDATTFMPAREGYTVTTKNCEDLRYCTELIALDLGHMKITNCEFLRYMPHLQYLILADTKIKDFSPLEGLQELIFLEIFLTEPADYTPLLSLTALEDLNISYTSGPNPELIAQMTWLKRLWWVGGGYYATALRQNLPDTELCFTGVSSTGNGWRQGQHYYDMRDLFGMRYLTT